MSIVDNLLEAQAEIQRLQQLLSVAHGVNSKMDGEANNLAEFCIGLAMTKKDPKQIMADVLQWQKVSAENRKLRAVLRALMPFVLEDYYPDCATPEFKAAVESAKELFAEPEVTDAQRAEHKERMARLEGGE